MRFVLLAIGLAGLGLLAPPAGGQDKKPPAKVEFPGFVDHIRIAGEVTRLDAEGEGEAKEVTGVSVRVVNAAIITNGRGYQSQTSDYTYSLPLHESAQVRWAAEPKKLDAKGKKVPNTPAERAGLKLPAGFPGFAGTRADLAVGQKVEVQLLRPKVGKPEAMTVADFKVKFVVISGEPTARKPPEDKDAAPAEGKKPAQKK